MVQKHLGIMVIVQKILNGNDAGKLADLSEAE
jgi:hypothetical protein